MTLAVLVWDVRVPALWVDESASIVATQRNWPDLWTLLEGAETPLVPYYSLLKVATSPLPSGSAPPEVLFRWPSIVVSALAMWTLTLWLARRCPARLAVATGIVLLLIGGFSRYGQEARPYAFALAAAVVSSVLWSRLTQHSGRRWVVLYGLSVAVLALAHLMTLGLVIAHVAAAVVTTRATWRPALLLRTMSGATLGLALVLPFLLAATRNGHGPSADQPVTPHYMAHLLGLLSNPSRPAAGFAVVAALAMVGATRVLSPTYGFVARLAVAWAVAPVIAMVPVFLLRPNLMMERYLLFVVPAWAILGGLGVVTLAEVVGRLPGTRAPAVLGAVVGVLVVAAAGAVQLDGLRHVRSTDGKGEDVRPALAAAHLEGRERLPIVTPLRTAALEFVPYDTDVVNRLAGTTVQRDKPSIWPSQVGRRQRQRILREHPTVLLLMRASVLGRCRWDAPGTPAEYVHDCMPGELRRMGYRVIAAEKDGRRWSSAVLSRDPSR